MDIAEIWDAYRKPLEAYIRRRTRNRCDAEDILQDAFLKICAGLDRLRDERCLRSWIFRIARSAVIDYYRKEKTRPPTAGERMEPGAAYGEEANLNREMAACLLSLTRMLPEKYREAVVRADLEGLPQIELCRKSGISFSGVKSRVQRGRRRLKELLADCCDVELDGYGNVIDYRVKNPACACVSRS